MTHKEIAILVKEAKGGPLREMKLAEATLQLLEQGDKLARAIKMALDKIQPGVERGRLRAALAEWKEAP